MQWMQSLVSIVCTLYASEWSIKAHGYCSVFSGLRKRDVGTTWVHWQEQHSLNFMHILAQGYLMYMMVAYTQRRLHFELEENLPKHTLEKSKQTFKKNCFFFSSLRGLHGLKSIHFSRLPWNLVQFALHFQISIFSLLMEVLDHSLNSVFY